MRLVYCSEDDQLGGYLKGLVSVVVASVLTNTPFSINCPVKSNGHHISKLVRDFFRPFDTYVSNGPWSKVRILRSFQIYNSSNIGMLRIGQKDVLLLGGQHFGPDKIFFQPVNKWAFGNRSGTNDWGAVHHYALRQAIKPVALLLKAYPFAVHLRGGDSFMMYNKHNRTKRWRWEREVRVNATAQSVLSCINNSNTTGPTYLATDNGIVKEELRYMTSKVIMSVGKPILTGLYASYTNTDIQSLFEDWYAIANADKIAVFRKSTFSETARWWGKGRYDPFVCTA